MRNNKELATLLVSEEFQGLNISRRKIVIEVAKRLLSLDAFADATKICVDQFTLNHILDESGSIYAQSLQKVFGSPWPEAKRVKLKLKEESPSD